ncbi:MAG: PIN domain-containing protein [Casimicrobium sp.]|jgi:tRNA(fMet)-specific endonuclease VapC
MNATYMLDTDTCAFILRRSSPALLARIMTVPLQQQVISVVTLAELLYGIQLSSKKKANQAALDALLRHLTLLELNADAALHYAEIRADLKKKGQLIGANDLMIAAHVRSINAVIVTNNVKDFGRVKGLKVENWMA